MAHPRKTIREKVVDIIKNGSTSAGTNVFETKVHPIQTGTRPAVRVWTREDNADGLLSIAPRNYRRIVSVVVDCVDSGSADMDDDVDDLCREVELLLEADTTLAGLAEDVEYISTSIEYDGSVDPAIAVASVSYDILYYDDMSA